MQAQRGFDLWRSSNPSGFLLLLSDGPEAKRFRKRCSVLSQFLHPFDRPKAKRSGRGCLFCCRSRRTENWRRFSHLPAEPFGGRVRRLCVFGFAAVLLKAAFASVSEDCSFEILMFLSSPALFRL